MRLSGVSPPMVLLAFNNDITTLERAVKERVFFVKNKDREFVEPPRPEEGVFAGNLTETWRKLRELLPSSAPLTGLEFVETFRGRKRKIYEAAYESLLGRSLEVKDSFVKVFVKYEKTDFTRKTDPVPRVISPRSPRYNVALGSFLRPIEERIFHSLAGLFSGHTTVFKGMNALASGRAFHVKWGMFRNPVAVGLDASRFDQHVSIQALLWEHRVYGHCFRRRRWKRRLAKLLRMQLRNKCTGFAEDGRLKYETVGGRMSGDMNTSLGNCVLMCSMIHAYALHCGVRVELANNGDDCVVIMESSDLERFSDGLDEWFTSMGFTMAVEAPCYTFEEIEFCQTHPVYVGPGPDDYLMVRHPKWAIAKDTMCVHGWQSLSMFKGWMHAVGTGGMAMTGGIPVFQDFYQTYLGFGKFRKAASDLQSWGVRQLSKGMKREYAPVEPSTRASFYWAFGVTPDEQLVLEDFYRNVKFGDDLLREVVYQTAMPL